MYIGTSVKWYKYRGILYRLYTKKEINEHIKGPCIDNLKFMYGKTIYYKKE
jgi:hypothetical protein